MSSVVALKAGDVSFLQGCVVAQGPITKAAPCYVVIVDDNSGSMQGSRQRECIRKTEEIIKACIDAGVSYQYAMFGSRSTQCGQCSVAKVSDYLRCNEGTRLMMLSDAAIDATKALLLQVKNDAEFRMLYILNTDGEASDGTTAAEKFRASFAEISSQYPNMLEPRSFVLGIGRNHDQKVLGAMSVGEATYYNYPDDSLGDMATDAVAKIVPELQGSRSRVSVKLSSGREVSVVNDSGVIEMNDVRVQPEENITHITLTDGTNIPIVEQILSDGSEEYLALHEKALQHDVLQLLAAIKPAAGSKNMKLLSSLQESYASLKARYTDLMAQKSAQTKSSERSMISFLNSQEQRANPEWRREMYSAMQQKIKKSRENTAQSRDILSEMLGLCESGLQAIRLGGLATEVEREYMELLSSGGFAHWTGKKKQHIVSRAQEQANDDSIVEADRKVQEVLKKMSSTSSTSNDNTRCWLTMMTGTELAQYGDVLCVVGYIAKGVRNLPLCSVSSAKVLHQAILNRQIQICPQPMSFLSLRELLLGGTQIAKGVHGGPVNTTICLVPAEGSLLSAAIANRYASLCASQLLTSRWIYTGPGTSEYRNGVLAALMAIAMQGTSEYLRQLLAQCVRGFCATYENSQGYLPTVVQRAIKFVEGETTGGEVPTIAVALADQMVRLAVSQSSTSEDEDAVAAPDATFYRHLFLRMLRDKMGFIFTARAAAGDVDGDAKRRQKERQAELFTEILVQGLHTTELNEFALDDIDANEVRIEVDETNGDGMVELSAYEQEDALDELGGGADDSSPNIEVSQRGPSLPDIVHHVLAKYETLPVRGAPDTLLSEEAVLAGGKDALRKYLVHHTLASLRRELRLMLNASQHMEYQVSHGVAAVDDEATLHGLLGFDSAEESHMWMLSQLVLSMKLMANSRYRAELERGEDSLLAMTPEALLISLSNGYTRKQQSAFEEAERIRKLTLKEKYCRKYLTHPSNFSTVPLRIIDEDHCRRINNYVRENFGFEIVMATLPMEPYTATGMAKNTYLKPRSPFFMKNIDPYLAIGKVFGSGADREESLFMEHLHTRAAAEYQRAITAANEKYESFSAAMNHFYPASKCVDDVFLELWVSMQVARYIGVEGAMDKVLHSIGDASLHDRAKDIAQREFLWISDPEEYLTNYFAAEPHRERLSLVDFINYVGATSEEDVELATLAFHESEELRK